MKLYDIVETSKMSAEYDGNLIEVTNRTSLATLENGRLVTIDASGNVVYATSATATRIYLHVSVEKMYDEGLGLTSFCAKQNELVRLFGMRSGDEFKTTAFTGTLVKGDKVVIGANGILAKAGALTGTENFVAEVIEVGKLGFESKSFGFSGIPAVTVKVISGKL